MKEIISKNGDLIAIVIENDFGENEFNFITKEEFPLQMGVNFYQTGSTIKPHYHIRRERIIDVIQEMVYIQKGKTSVDLYDLDNNKFETVELYEGDSIFFVDGGHGFNILEDTKIIEIKQGPYLGRDVDKKEIK